MKREKHYKYLLILLLPLAILLNYLSKLNPELVETYYSRGINKYITMFISKVFSIFPFSLYDIIMIALIIGLIFYGGLTTIRTLKDRNINALKKFTLNLLLFSSTIYFFFIFLWGINYNRMPLERLMGLENVSVSSKDLENLYMDLVLNANRTREEISNDTNAIESIDSKMVLKKASLGYENVDEEYLKGNYGKPVPLVFSEGFNYTGITGIYFPYTGQAGINVKAPSTLIPATALHEMAHQRGFAREDEANFLAFYAGVRHDDINFRYSAYLLAISNVRNALGSENRERLKELDENLSVAVKNDINYNISFWENYEGKIEKIGSKINDAYLKGNGVLDGEKSYGRMVDLLLKDFLNK